jgi:hypothetical protein
VGVPESSTTERSKAKDVGSGISFGGTPAASSVDVEIDRVDEMLAQRAAAHVDVERVQRRPTRP